MAVCTFFLKGQCKFGDQCRFEHPKGGGTGAGAFGASSWGNSPNKKAEGAALPFTQESIIRDMTSGLEKPLWPLSSYAPAKHEPLLITGLDESFEELRAKAAGALKAGNVNEYTAYEKQKIDAAEQTFANVKSNPQEALKTAMQNSQSDGAVATKAPFGSAFGQSSTSAFGQPANTTSAFGQPAQISAFGKPSAFGQPSTTSAFGSSSAFGQPATKTSAFGQTAPQTSSAFGQPAQQSSPFGSSAPQTSAFGQSAQQKSAFGQPTQTSAFGQTSTPGSSFGQPSTFGQTAPSSVIKPATGGAFGAYANTGPSAFGAGASGSGGGGFSAFANKPSTLTGAAAAVNSGAASSPFGQQPQQTSAFGNVTPLANSPFGQQNTTAQGSAFGSTSGASPFGAQPTQSAFGNIAAPSAFGTQPQPQQPQANTGFAGLANSPFGAKPGATTQSAFGAPAQPSTFTSAPAQQSAFSAPTQQSAFGVTSTPQSSFSAAAAQQSAFGAPGAQKLPFGLQAPAMASQVSVSMAAASPTVSLDFGPKPGVYKPGTTPYDMLLPQDYMSKISEEAREAFKSAKFTWGKVPDWIPPLELR